ncbi:MAG: lysine exporter LysO family protein [Eubacterium sp.]|nr:lysine exporter LysO family protein [Candidatus Colimonas fimequi]
MYMIFVYWGILIVSYFIASRLRNYADKFTYIDKLMMLAIYILVFIMGLRMGINEKVLTSIGTIGMQSLVITLLAIAGSVGAVFIARKLVSMDRYGNIKGSVAPEESGEKKHVESAIDLKGTLVIVALVAIGVILGKVIIVDHMPDILPWFSDFAGNLLTWFLCVLIVIIGFELGLSGTVVSNIKKAGLRILVIPLAIVIGSFIFGSGAAFLMGFSIKESLAIVGGFGWYSYAPVVISAAGQQYAVASAVAFMHNVFRETFGIIFIPIFAKKIGYLESLALPGIGTMDVCMPMVENSCREDTVAYGFISGFLICILTSAGVPLLMNL